MAEFGPSDTAPPQTISIQKVRHVFDSLSVNDQNNDSHTLTELIQLATATPLEQTRAHEILEKSFSNANDLRTLVDGQGATLIDLQQKLANHDIAFKHLQCQLLETKNELQKLRASTTAMAPTINRRSAKIPDPAKFSGKVKDNDAFEHFRNKIYNKFKLNADHFATEEQKVGYLFSLLGMGPSRIVNCHMEIRADHTIDSIFEHMERIYGDPHAKIDSRQKMQNCRQKNRPFHEWITEFHLHATRVGWNDEVICAFLLQNMSTELQDHLHTIQNYRKLSFAELVCQLSKLANTLQTYPGTSKPS